MALFTVMGSIDVPIEIQMIVYYNRGWIKFDPESRFAHHLAITPVNVLVWMAFLSGLLICGLSAFAWFTGRWRFAWIGTILFFVLMFTSKWLESL